MFIKSGSIPEKSATSPVMQPTLVCWEQNMKPVKVNAGKQSFVFSFSSSHVVGQLRYFRWQPIRTSHTHKSLSVFGEGITFAHSVLKDANFFFFLLSTTVTCVGVIACVLVCLPSLSIIIILIIYIQFNYKFAPIKMLIMPYWFHQILFLSIAPHPWFLY